MSNRSPLKAPLSKVLPEAPVKPVVEEVKEEKPAKSRKQTYVPQEQSAEA